MLVILDDDLVTSCIEGHVFFICLATITVVPLVNQELAVDENPDTVIRQSIKAVNTCLQVKLPDPLHREVIVWQFDGRRAFFPVKVDLPVVAGDRRAAL